MLYDGRQISNFILDYCESRGRRVSNLMLQKILYFCHVWTLVQLGRPLIKHKFEAWQFGPVLPYIYQDFKAFERDAISIRATTLNAINGQRETATYQFETELAALLEQVIDFYSHLSSGQLVDLSHAPDGPWAKVWYDEGHVRPGMLIEDRDIQKYYSSSNRDYEKLESGHV